MRTAAAFLLMLTGLAVLAVALLQPYRHDCDRIQREALWASAAMAMCSQSMSCRFTYRELVVVMKQRLAAERCRNPMTRETGAFLQTPPSLVRDPVPATR